MSLNIPGFEKIFKNSDEGVAKSSMQKQDIEFFLTKRIIEVKAKEMESDGTSFIELSGDGIIYWEFQNNLEVHITGGNFRIPDDFEGENIKVNIFILGLSTTIGAGGETRFRIDCERRREGISGRISETGTYQDITLLGNANTSIVKVTQEFTELTLKTGDFIGFDIHRKGDDVEDDFEFSVGLIGITIERV